MKLIWTASSSPMLLQHLLSSHTNIVFVSVIVLECTFQSCVTERCKLLRLLAEGSTVCPLKGLQSRPRVSANARVCIHTHSCSDISAPCTHVVTRHKQNHLCVLWLGIAVAELCWAQPGHCWGLGCHVSTDGEGTHTHSHTHRLCLSPPCL